MPVSVAHSGHPPGWVIVLVLLGGALLAWGVIAGLGVLLSLIA